MPNVAGLVPKLIITRGLPASGKSTWARAQKHAIRVNRDDLRRMMHGGFTGHGAAEKQVTLVQRAAIEALLKAGVTVIADDTNLRPSTVGALRKLARQNGAGSEVVDFTHVDLETCIARDAHRPETERVGASVIRQMYEMYLSS